MNLGEERSSRSSSRDEKSDSDEDEDKSSRSSSRSSRSNSDKDDGSDRSRSNSSRSKSKNDSDEDDDSEKEKNSDDEDDESRNDSDKSKDEDEEEDDDDSKSKSSRSSSKSSDEEKSRRDNSSDSDSIQKRYKTSHSDIPERHEDSEKSENNSESKSSPRSLSKKKSKILDTSVRKQIIDNQSQENTPRGILINTDDKNFSRSYSKAKEGLEEQPANKDFVKKKTTFYDQSVRNPSIEADFLPSYKNEELEERGLIRSGSRLRENFEDASPIQPKKTFFYDQQSRQISNEAEYIMPHRVEQDYDNRALQRSNSRIPQDNYEEPPANKDFVKKKTTFYDYSNAEPLQPNSNYQQVAVDPQYAERSLIRSNSRIPQNEVPMEDQYGDRGLVRTNSRIVQQPYEPEQQYPDRGLVRTSSKMIQQPQVYPDHEQQYPDRGLVRSSSRMVQQPEYEQQQQYPDKALVRSGSRIVSQQQDDQQYPDRGLVRSSSRNPQVFNFDNVDYQQQYQPSQFHNQNMERQHSRNNSQQMANHLRQPSDPPLHLPESQQVLSRGNSRVFDNSQQLVKKPSINNIVDLDQDERKLSRQASALNSERFLSNESNPKSPKLLKKSSTNVHEIRINEVVGERRGSGMQQQSILKKAQSNLPNDQGLVPADNRMFTFKNVPEMSRQNTNRISEFGKSLDPGGDDLKSPISNYLGSARTNNNDEIIREFVSPSLTSKNSNEALFFSRKQTENPMILNDEVMQNFIAQDQAHYYQQVERRDSLRIERKDSNRSEQNRQQIERRDSLQRAGSMRGSNVPVINNAMSQYHQYSQQRSDPHVMQDPYGMQVVNEERFKAKPTIFEAINHDIEELSDYLNDIFPSYSTKNKSKPSHPVKLEPLERNDLAATKQISQIDHDDNPPPLAYSKSNTKFFGDGRPPIPQGANVLILPERKLTSESETRLQRNRSEKTITPQNENRAEVKVESKMEILHTEPTVLPGATSGYLSPKLNTLTSPKSIKSVVSEYKTIQDLYKKRPKTTYIQEQEHPEKYHSQRQKFAAQGKMPSLPVLKKINKTEDKAKKEKIEKAIEILQNKAHKH